MNYYKTLVLRLALPLIISYSLLSQIFHPLTLYTSYIIIKTFNSSVTILSPYLITFSNYIRFSQACAVISAYFLLVLLLAFTKDISFKIGLKILSLGSLIIFTTNIIRILILIFVLETHGFNTFQPIHDIFWVIFGSLIVALTWIILTRFYKVNSVPIYSDLKYLLKQTKIFKQ
jgi:exosortase/archaeosortase family protein